MIGKCADWILYASVEISASIKAQPKAAYRAVRGCDNIRLQVVR